MHFRGVQFRGGSFVGNSTDLLTLKKLYLKV